MILMTPSVALVAESDSSATVYHPDPMSNKKKGSLINGRTNIVVKQILTLQPDEKVLDIDWRRTSQRHGTAINLAIKRKAEKRKYKCGTVGRDVQNGRPSTTL